MTKTNFKSVLDDYTNDQVVDLAAEFVAEGYRLQPADLDEIMNDRVKNIFTSAPAESAWSDQWIFENPRGQQFAVFSAGGGVIVKIAKMDGSGAGRRSMNDDLAAALLVAAA